MSFEEFQPRDVSGSDEPVISLRKSGSFGINQACIDEYFEDAEGIKLYYDKENNRVGLEGREENTSETYVLTESASGGTVTAYAFINRYQLKPKVTTRYKAEEDEDNGFVVIDLDEPIGTYGTPDEETDGTVSTTKEEEEPAEA
jgi:hypothetical protein